ncbi:MAG: DUF1538 domain-containing protein [Deltaproteobacteria bacterium]|nr:DUF1538 domain-containing protein [Deltaproteobacteria bacterium]
MADKKSKRIKINMRQALALLFPYIKDRVMSQIKSVWLIILYLVFFQTIILRIPISESSVIAFGIGLVIIGLTIFMEGLFLGLMRLGSLVGSGLPKKSPITVILTFGLLLGFLATLAEPSIHVLQMAGKTVKPWEAPLLFILLNKYSHYLVYAVGAGVGVAVALGMLRFYYSISLKPFIYLFVGPLVLVTVWASLDSNLKNIIGLAWDCGAVTTGPVTVPLVLALGIGISRMVGSADSGATGFGVVTLASLLPIVAVLGLGIYLNSSVPQPMSETDFFKKNVRSQIEVLFRNKDDLTHYVLMETSPQAQLSFFGGNHEEMLRYLKDLAMSEPKRKAVFGAANDALERWAFLRGTKEQQKAVFGHLENMQEAASQYTKEGTTGINIRDLGKRNLAAAIKAIGLLAIPILIVFFLLVRESMPYPDEIVLGIFFCILGLATFGMGIELGLDRLGTQIGSKLPASFKAISLPDDRKTISNFDFDMVHVAISSDGEKRQFFFSENDGKMITIPYDPSDFDQLTGQYRYTPVKGPLFGSGSPLPGILVVILFAFIMGYGATLAEPALNALGATVEELTAGTFRKSLLMQAVAVGVGGGIALGITKIVLDIPLAWILVPPYIILILITKFSTEEFVNIGWDSAGVTTGPITVPLVLAMGLGIGTQVGVIEGFGILASASVCPILSVLLLGLHIDRKRKAALAEESFADEEAGKDKK